MEVTGYEARQTSKEQTKMPRFMLEGPRPCTIFVSRSYVMHELRNQHVSIG